MIRKARMDSNTSTSYVRLKSSRNSSQLFSAPGVEVDQQDWMSLSPLTEFVPAQSPAEKALDVEVQFWWWCSHAINPLRTKTRLPDEHVSAQDVDLHDRWVSSFTSPRRTLDCLGRQEVRFGAFADCVHWSGESLGAFAAARTRYCVTCSFDADASLASRVQTPESKCPHTSWTQQRMQSLLTSFRNRIQLLDVEYLQRLSPLPSASQICALQTRLNQILPQIQTKVCDHFGLASPKCNGIKKHINQIIERSQDLVMREENALCLSQLGRGSHAACTQRHEIILGG
jgi:hypothetical protein